MVGLVMVGCTEHVVFQEVASAGRLLVAVLSHSSLRHHHTLARDVYLDIRHTGDYRLTSTSSTLQGPGGHSFTDANGMRSPIQAGAEKAPAIFGDRFQASSTG
jgi:hypothetical protein